MSDKPKSRQVKWQEKMIAEGRCRQCAVVLTNGKTKCDPCLKKSNKKIDKLQKA